MQLNTRMLQSSQISPKSLRARHQLGGYGGAIPQCPLAGGCCSPASSSSSSRDLYKAPGAWNGLFLSLAALTLTSFAVPLAPALLANPFYRQLNIAQAAKQNLLLGRATWGSAALLQYGQAGGSASIGGGQ